MDNKKLIDDLNEDLAGELQAIIQYLQHSFMIMGLKRLPISDLLEDVAKDEMKHAQILAERIVAMGGVPTVKPRPIKQAATIKEMLELDLAAEKGALEDYAKRIKQAEEAGEVGTSLIIENILVDEQGHWDSFTKLLREQQ